MEHCKHKCSPNCRYFPNSSYYLTENDYIYDSDKGCYVPTREIIPICFHTEKQIINWELCPYYAPKRFFKKKIIIFIGKSASGKDTALNYLESQYGIKPIVSLTTRPMRVGEVNEKEYQFVSAKDFLDKKEKGILADYREYKTLVNGKEETWYYGIERKDLQSEEIRSTCVDMVGYQNLAQWFSKREMLVINLTAKEKTRKERAIARGSFDETEWKRRAKDDEKKLNDKTVGVVSDYVIQNDKEINNLYLGIEEILKAEKIK